MKSRLAGCRRVDGEFGCHVSSLHMRIILEFANSSGSESIAGNIEPYDGPLPMIGDVIYLDMERKFRVVERTFYYLASFPDRFTTEMKVSLHCEPFDRR
jgi:hypothetical protein